jgi:hypothetical protein
MIKHISILTTYILFLSGISSAQENSKALTDAMVGMKVSVKNNKETYVDKSSPVGITETNACYLYIERTGSNAPILWMKVQYYGINLLDVHSYKLACYDNDIEFNGSMQKMIHNGNYFSSSNIRVTPAMLAICRSINVNTAVKLTYLGNTSNKKRLLSADEKLAIANVIKLYDLLKDN